jgi:hypothetical protein
MRLEKLTNRDLYDEWTECMETMVQEPENAYARRREDACMNEIIRRLQEASRRPLQRQEA